MSTKRTASTGRNSRDERGDPSEKALKITIVVCLIGLIGVYLFAFAPKPSAPTSPAPRTVAATQAGGPVAKFDRDSLSTKSR